MIRSAIALALGSLFQPPPPVFFLRSRPAMEDVAASMLSDETPAYGPSSVRNRSRRHSGVSASAFAISSRMNIPRGVHRDAKGAEKPAVRESPARKSGRRNGSRK